MKTISLDGMWNVRLQDGVCQQVSLPGTLDENHVGIPDRGINQWHPDEANGNADDLQGSDAILTRLTRVVTYEGPAWFERTLTIEKPQNTRIFVKAERSRKLALTLNGQFAPMAVKGTISTPYLFEITDQLVSGENTFAFCCDNSYPGWPREDIVYSSAATDETQTNWNGILGTFEIQFCKPNFISDVRVYPTLTTTVVAIEINCKTPYHGRLSLYCDAFSEPVYQPVMLDAGTNLLRFTNIPLMADCKRWDLQESNLYTLTVKAGAMDAYTVMFGVRTFGACSGHLTLNDRPVFIRSEANCCVFPQTGHMPLDLDAWRNVLKTYQDYGVNCMRFHSHCPPDAAFTAADQLGMLMQAELSHWNPRNALETDESYAYYKLEMTQILRAYANHPSFVMLTFGNELHAGEIGHARMDVLLSYAKTLDATRMYANGSNVHYGMVDPSRHSDFYTSSNYLEHMLRGTSQQMLGHINNQYPSARKNYDAEMEALRQVYDKPVFSFEVGQFEVLPDFDELTRFTGVTRADNIAHIQERVKEEGYLEDWKQRVEATGELSLLGYREEVEAALRTASLSGISLLGLQDFPGQGTALVGMLNSHLEAKPYPFAAPERFRAFFTDVLPLALLPRYTYKQKECLQVPIQLANYGKQKLCAKAKVTLYSGDDIVAEQTLPEQEYEVGTLSDAGTVEFALQTVQAPQKLRLSLTIGQAQNNYSIWVYPESMKTASERIVVTESLEEAVAALQSGQKVLLDPPADEAHLPQSIQAQFTTDFWSVGTFSKQSGFMGCLVNPQHPVFKQFPTEQHTDWQWWPMCKGRALLLPPGTQSLVTGIDCYARLRNLGLLIETKALGGTLMLSGMGLLHKQEYPEAQALLASILGYMESEDFHPEQSLTKEQLESLVR